MKNVRLVDLLEFLGSQTEQDFRGDSVDRYLRDHRLLEGELHPFTFFREDTYGRNLVCKTELFEMMVLTWLPRHRTPIHDHGSSRCWMLMDTGTLTFRNYEYPDLKAPQMVCKGKADTVSAGQDVYIDDGLGVHSICNASEKPAVSLHLYAGPIPRCRIYDEAKKTFDWVDLVYFTSLGVEAYTLPTEVR